MLSEFVSYLSSKKKVLFLTTSNRWDGEKEVPKSTQLAQDVATELIKKGVEVVTLDVPSLKIYPCEGNVSNAKGNSCGVVDSALKDVNKNPSGCHRCWASINHPDDELWKISKALLESDAVVFFISVRWGQTNAFYQKLIERLNWLENRHTTLGESNVIGNIEAGCVVIGQNWRSEEIKEIQKQVYSFYGFKVPPQLSLNWQYTIDFNDESQASYKRAENAFLSFFGMLKTRVQEFSKFLGFGEFLNEESFYEKFPHKIQNEAYWRRVLANSDYCLNVLDTVMKKQRGYASPRQMEVMRREERGDKTPYPTKY